MELISKDALEAKLMLCMDMNRADWSYNKMIMANKMLEILDQEPIIEERKHGYWIFIERDKYNNFIQCSVCESKFGLHSNDNYCQSCGAIMDKEDIL